MKLTLNKEVYENFCSYNITPYLFNIDYPEGGGFTTTFGISNVDYRRTIHNTKANMIYSNKNNQHTFYIYGDWGQRHTLIVSNDMPEVIESLKKYIETDFGF